MKSDNFRSSIFPTPVLTLRSVWETVMYISAVKLGYKLCDGIYVPNADRKTIFAANFEKH